LNFFDSKGGKEFSSKVGFCFFSLPILRSNSKKKTHRLVKGRIDKRVLHPIVLIKKGSISKKSKEDKIQKIKRWRS
jgi:hypothetical protein